MPPEPLAAAKNVQPSPESIAPQAGTFDSIRIQGIFYRAASPLAIVNGKSVGIGDSFNAFKVVAIDQHSVTLQRDGERKVFKLN